MHKMGMHLEFKLECKWTDLYSVISIVHCNYTSGAELHSGIQCRLPVSPTPRPPKVVTSCTQTWWRSLLAPPNTSEEGRKGAVMNRILSVPQEKKRGVRFLLTAQLTSSHLIIITECLMVNQLQSSPYPPWAFPFISFPLFYPLRGLK